MKKMDGSLSRLISGFAVLFLIFSISNGCTKSENDNTIGLEYALDPSGNPVSIGTDFNPVEIFISVGDIVTWTNNSPQVQTVTSDDGLMDAIISQNGTYSYKFTSAGTYNYHNRIHVNMQGRVIVK